MMFGFWRRGADGDDRAASGVAVSVALIGEGYRRSHVKGLLDGRVGIAAELATDKRARMLEEIGPGVVVLDCASENVNPLLALPKLAALEGSPHVVALTDGSMPGAFDTGALARLGADAAADVRDPRAVVEAVLPSRLPSGTEPSRDKRGVLAAA